MCHCWNEWPFLASIPTTWMRFFRVRVASQSRIAECMDKSAAKEREKAKKLLKQIGKLNARYVKDYEEAVSTVTEDLKKKYLSCIQFGSYSRTATVHPVFL